MLECTKPGRERFKTSEKGTSTPFEYENRDCPYFLLESYPGGYFEVGEVADADAEFEDQTAVRSPLESADQIDSRSGIEIVIVVIDERNPESATDVGSPAFGANHVEGVQVNVSHDTIVSEPNLEGRLKSNPPRELARVDVNAQMDLVGIDRYPSASRPAAEAELRLGLGDRRAGKKER
jgi:hypothetical protein